MGPRSSSLGADAFFSTSRTRKQQVVESSLRPSELALNSKKVSFIGGLYAFIRERAITGGGNPGLD